MRLWHKDLIEVLPRQQLLAQWRECCCIARNIAVNDTPNHILVNKIMDYPNYHFYNYAKLVQAEMQRRRYSCDFNKFTQWFDLYSGNGYPIRTIKIISKQDIFKYWHTKRYLTQCYYNLQEKYDCGGISEDEWSKVAQMYNLRYTKKK